MSEMLRSRTWAGLGSILLFTVVMPAWAQEPPTELLLFTEIPKIVTATMFEQTVVEAPSIVSVVTEAEIANSTAQTVLEVLRMIPGVGTYISHYGQGEIEIRGIKTDSSEKVKMMVDGIPINEPFFGGGLIFWDHMTVKNIKRIEVVRGPGSALYGTDAFVGTVNVITKQPGDIKGMTVSGGGGSYNTKNFGLLSGGENASKVKIIAMMDWLDSDGPKLRVEKDMNYGAPWDMSPGDTKLYRTGYDFFLRAAYEEFSLDLRYAKTKRGDYIGLLGNLNRSGYLDEGGFFGQLAYKWTFLEKTQVLAKLFYNQFDEHILWEMFPAGFLFSYPEGSKIDLTASTNNTGLELQVSQALFAGNRFLFGAQAEWKNIYNVTQKTNADPLTGAYQGYMRDYTQDLNWIKPDAKRNVLALYGQDEWSVTTLGLGVTAGVRYDRYSDFGSTVNPRLGLVQKVTAHENVKVLYGTAFRAPNFRELYDQNNPNTKGNTDLKPETITSAEVSLESDMYTPGALARLNYYNNRIRDQILVETTTTSGPKPFVNTRDVVYTYGVELEVKYPLELNLWNASAGGDYVYASGAYQHAEKSGSALLNVPIYRGDIGVNLGCTEYMNVNINNFYRGKIDVGNDAFLEPVLVTDLAVTVHTVERDTELKLTATNVFDRPYKDPAEWSNVISHLPREGRAYFASLSTRF